MRFLMAISFILLANSLSAQCNNDRAGSQPARGVVFADINGNGRRETNETGIAGVALSNGCDVVISDGDGRYEISIAPTEIIFLSKPANYSVPVDESNVPQFFYRHYPDGIPAQIAGTSVEWLWPVTEATGPLPTSIDFPLIPAESKIEFLAHGFADTQARYETGQDMVREDLVNPLIDNPFGVQQ